MPKKQKNNKVIAVDDSVIMGPDGEPMMIMPPNFDFTTAIQVWQGAPKTGKTSTASALGTVAKRLGIPGIRPFFLIFEPGTGGVDIEGTSRKCECKGKDKSCSVCGGLGVVRLVLDVDVDPQDPLKTVNTWFEWVVTTAYNPIVIDTADAMHRVLSDGVCMKMGISGPHKSDHGIAWSELFNEWREKLSILVNSGKGVILLSHLYYQEKKLRGGATMQSATFNIGGKSKPYLEGLANQIIHFEVVPSADVDKHIISTRRTAGIEAGDHWGVYPDELDRGQSSEEGAEAILRCWYEVSDK